MDTARELAELAHRMPELALRLGDELSGAVGPVDAGPEHLQHEAEPEQPLLHAVVEIPLETAPLAVRGPDEPAAGRAQLRELQSKLCVEPLVFERQTRHGSRGLDQRALIDEVGVVDDGCDGAVTHWTAKLSQGTLTIEGVMSGAPKAGVQRLAIVGGSGRYEGAHGTVTVSDAGAGRTLAVVRWAR